jgi:hypothetical protein
MIDKSSFCEVSIHWANQQLLIRCTYSPRQ